MAYKFSPSTGGLYRDDVHSDIPEDAITLSDEDYRKCLNGLNSGQAVAVSKTGKVTVKAPTLSLEDLAAAARLERDAKLAASDWSQGRDIPDEIAQKWATYRQALRDVPEQNGFPEIINWPEAPK